MVLTLLALAGCGGVPAAVEKAPPAPAPATALPAAAPVTAAATPAPPPPRQYPEPATLNGLDADQLAGLLGAPRFKRRDDPAEIWQYRDDTCALDVFLYRAGKDGAYRVRYFETRGRGQAPVDQKDCFVGLLKAREQGRAG